MAELLQLKQVYDNEKERSKALEIKIAEFREEILKIKNEKQKLSMNLKQKKDECEALKDKTKGLTDEKEALQNGIKEKIGALDLKDAELVRTKRENETVKKDFIKIERELENLKLCELNHTKSVYKCDICDVSVENYDELKLHKRRYHSHNKASQY